ncbi:TetR/AcrR family transcriptional regulator [Streptomyces sp. NPDC098789]|uniref:TetR/AcrR family transcriptional regulator n=1 Tax=Streptomyces sp. NPDC098789 TaxID=3366098 RepID=UPI00381CC65B
MARPRGVDDLAILRAATEVMGRVGPAGFTLAAVAREVALVPATLTQRFGSKRGLLLALADRTVEDIGELIARVRAVHEGALDALAALIAEWTAAMDTPETFANHLAFWCADLGDPELYERALTVHRAQTEAILGLLTEAVAAGELRSGTDAAALARTVQVVIAGTGVTWAVAREGGLAQRLRQELDTALSPHVPT